MSKKRTGSGGGKSKARTALLVVLAIFILLTVLAFIIRCAGTLPGKPDTPNIPNTPNYKFELDKDNIVF